jgi:hypothetical protein
MFALPGPTRPEEETEPNFGWPTGFSPGEFY